MTDCYKCKSCGNVIMMKLESKSNSFKCCDIPMILLKELEKDGPTEKHVPVVTKQDDGYLVQVGVIPHPMDEDHYIQYIELIYDGFICTKYLKPGDEPSAFFRVEANEFTVREYCNLHGLWINKHKT